MKYYIQSGDLKKIVSTSDSPKTACKKALDEFIYENKGSLKMSICPLIAISERGFRFSEKIYGKYQEDAIFFNVEEIIDHNP